ncbi:hypothetical protein D3C85_1181990 [compost metagenome]
MQSVAGKGRSLDIQFRVQKSHANALQRGLEEQPLSEAEHLPTRYQAPIEAGLLEELDVCEQHFEHPGCRNEVDNIGLGYGTPECFEGASYREVFPGKANANGF